MKTDVYGMKPLHRRGSYTTFLRGSLLTTTFLFSTILMGQISHASSSSDDGGGDTDPDPDPDLVLFQSSYHDSTVTYRLYDEGDIENVNPVFIPLMQKKIIEKQVTTWLTIDQQAYVSFEISNFDYSETDFITPDKIVIGPEGTIAYREGEIVNTEEPSEFYVNLYENHVQELLHQTEESNNHLTEITPAIIAFLEMEGFSHFEDGEEHIFSSPELELRYDPTISRNVMISYDEEGSKESEVIEYYNQNEDGMFYPGIIQESHYYRDVNGLCYTENIISVRSDYELYLNPEIESYQEMMLQSVSNEAIIFPNPASDNFSITFADGEANDIREVQLISHGSVLVKSWTGNYDENSTFSVSDIQPGTYLVKIDKDKGNNTYYAIIQIQ